MLNKIEQLPCKHCGKFPADHHGGTKATCKRPKTHYEPIHSEKTNISNDWRIENLLRVSDKLNNEWGWESGALAVRWAIEEIGQSKDQLALYAERNSVLEMSGATCSRFKEVLKEIATGRFSDESCIEKAREALGIKYV